jgi:putative hydrolase of the HAD superfamily
MSAEIQAIIFDFDGLILDTETPEYNSWCEIFDEHGCTLPLATWVTCIGTAAHTFDPYAYLAEQLGQPVALESIRTRRRARMAELMAAQTLLPGVADYLAYARSQGIKLAVASSSAHKWVDPLLARFELTRYFDHVLCADDVTHTKPDPELYNTALKRLEVAPEAAIAFEDSPNGLLAAKRAGLYCVIVPNSMTTTLHFEQPDRRLSSLAEVPLQELLRHIHRA